MPEDLSLGASTSISRDIDISGGGTSVTLPSATNTKAGLMSGADKTIINNLDNTYIKQGGNPIVGNLIFGMSGSYSYLFQSGGATVATLDSGGSFAASSVKNIGGSAFSYIGLTTSGTAISRNLADSNPVLLVNQLNASSTGNTLSLQKMGANQLTVSNSGVLKVDDLAGTGTRVVTADSTGTLSATTEVSSGSYSPSCSGSDTYAPSTFYYTRIDNKVHVWGSVSVSNISSAGEQSFTLELPISTTTVSSTDISGVVTGKIVPSLLTDGQNNYIEASGSAAINATVNFSTDNSEATLFVQFDYIIQ